MNWYEAKQEEKRQRYEQRAQRAAGESIAQSEAARKAVEHIPPGQPILVGHHSEGRHRRDLARSDSHMRKAIEADSKAKHYAHKADAVGSGGISSDDPDAVTKLREKLANLEQRQSRMKEINALFRKGGADALPEDERLAWFRLKGLCPYEKAPYPAYALTNNSGNMRRIKARIAQLERAEAAREAVATGEAVEAVTEGPGYVMREDLGENRVMFEFRGKPAADVRAILKRHGFRWSPSRVAWVRFLNNAGRAAAQSVARQLNDTEAAR